MPCHNIQHPFSMETELPSEWSEWDATANTVMSRGKDL